MHRRDRQRSSKAVKLKSKMAASVNVSGGVGPSGTTGQGIATFNAFPDEKKIRELTEQIRQRLSHAHQLKLTASQQQATPAASTQISQAEEIKKRLQEAIVQLQETVKDFSLSGIQEWLSGVAQRLNLKLELQRSQQVPEANIFLIHDGFYVEVCCQDKDKVTSVKLSQANTTQEESVELANLLRAGDFAAFEIHLKSLVQFYNQAAGGNCEPALMYRALSAIEAVLLTINENCPPQTAIEKVIMENPFGHVTPRRGGIPMQLTFFVHPYEVIKNALILSKLGVSVGVAGKVTMEKSPNISMLSTDPNLFDVSTANFFPVTVQNSSMLPLTFVFELSEAIPVCSMVRDELLKICGTEQPVLPVGSVHINQLIAKRKAEKEGRDLITDKWRLVCLPDQYHYYVMPAELRSVDALPDQIASSQFCGAMVAKVPFLHPGKMFIIIMLLRKQLVYNALISSCLGRSKRGVPSPPSEVAQCIFEVTSQPPNQVTVTMDMQSEETLTVEFAVPDQNPTAVVVRVKTTTDASPVLQDNLSKIAQRCLSIPVTLRAALKHPTQLLGNKPALLLQRYCQSMKDFDLSICSEEAKDDDICITGAAPMDIGDHMTMLGREQKLTNMM